MQSLSISEISEKKSATITGYLFIKKNIFWSERYVRMGDGKLSYYEEKTDTTPRGVFNLKNAEVVEKYGGKDAVVLLKVRYGPTPELYIKIEKPLFRTKFIRCLYDNIKGEEKNQKQVRDFQFQGLEDPTHNDYPALPDQYKSYYNKKFQLSEIVQSQYIYHEVTNKSKKTKSVSRLTSTSQAFFLGLVIGGVLVSSVISIPAVYITIVIGILSLILFLLQRKKGSFKKLSQTQFIRKQYIVHTQLDEIFNVIQNMRSNLYSQSDVKFIFNEELYFQEDNKYQLIQKDINRLRYLWQFIPSDGRTLVSIIYSQDNPQICLSLLEPLTYKIKTIEISKKVPSLKRNTLNTSTFSPLSSQIRSKSVLPIVPISSMKEMDIQDDSVPTNQKKILSSLQQMKILYPKTPESLLHQCIASRKKFTQTIEMQYDRTESKNNCQMSVREMEGGLMVTKGVTTLKADVDEVVKYVRDLQKRGEYDGMFNSGKVLEQFQISAILYQKFNGIFPVSARDFVLLLTVQNIQNGVMIHGKSTSYLKYDADSKSVRGQVLSAGFLIKNVGAGNVEITYLTYSDPAGKLPDMIKKKAGNMQSGVIMKIRQNLLKRFKQ